MKISMLDHTQVSQGRTVQDTLHEAVQLAQAAEQLGYSRFWLSEHHGSKALASSSPEILIAHVAAATKRIRVGSGGIMLPHYSAYKVAENFRLLEALHPGRIDAGFGRAPGGMPIATQALQEGKMSDIREYPRQVEDFGGYLHDALPEGHRFVNLQAQPSIQTAPEVWLLGSSDESARIAAAKGTAYSFAQFFGTPGGEAAIRHYRENFRPSVMNDKRPHTMIAVSVFCADTEEEARRLASSSELFFSQLTKGADLPYFPSVETAMNFPYTPYDEYQIATRRQNAILGTPEQVREQLHNIKQRYDADELMIVCMIHDFEARMRSFELTAKAVLA
jgi:luciferase family oxidoreductase group 1